MVDLLRLVLATWRLTALLVYDDGPFHSFQRLRDYAQVADPDEQHINGALSCVWCCSIWAALGVLLVNKLLPGIVDILALSAGAILYDKYTAD